MKRLCLIVAISLLSIVSLAAQGIAPVAKQQFLDNNGRPCAGCKLYSYAAGTTTPLATYSDAGLTIPNQNPITLDSAGRAPALYLSSAAYKFVLQTPAGVTIWTQDQVMHPADLLRIDLASAGAGKGADLIVNALRRVGTLDELKMLPKPNYPRTVYLLGRLSPGDGGEGIFRWDGSDLSSQVSADPLAGIYVAPETDPSGASGAWVRQFTGMMNVRWWGAVGDGATDDTAALQAAVNATAGQCSLFLPRGTYVISDSIVVSAPANKYLTVLGENYVRSSIKAVGTTPFTAVFLFDPAVRHSYLTFRDFTVDGNNVANHGFYAVENSTVSGMDHALFEHLNIRGTRVHAIYIENGWCNTVSKSLIANNYGDGVFMWRVAANAINIVDSKMVANGGLGVHIANGNGVRISGNTIEKNKAGGLVINSTKGFEVTGNYFESNGNRDPDPVVPGEDFGISLGPVAVVQGGVVQGNYVTGSLSYAGLVAIRISYAQDVKITHNEIKNCSSGIDLGDAQQTYPKRVLIENNTEDVILTSFVPPANATRLAHNGNRIRIPSVMRQTGNLINVHPVRWARAVGGTSAVNVIPGEFPSFTMYRGDQTCYIYHSLDASKAQEELRGSYVTFAILAKADVNANVTLKSPDVNRAVTVTPTLEWHCLTFYVPTDATTIWAGIENTTVGATVTIRDSYFVGGLERPAESREFVLTNSNTWDPGNLAAGASTTRVVHMVGAELGDFVQVAAPYDLQGLSASAYVSAADQVTIVLYNGTAGPIDLPSGSWQLVLRKK